MSKIAPASDVRRYVSFVLEAEAVSPEQLGERAGFNGSTLRKFLKDENPDRGLNLRTLEAIEGYFGITLDQFKSGMPGAGDDVAPYTPPVRRPDREGYTVITRALDLDGLYPGDVLVVDPAAAPRDGDVVVATTRDPRLGRSRRVLRIYQAPYLIARSSRTMLKPLLMDEDVHLAGVVTAAVRSFRGDCEPRRKEVIESAA